MDDLALSNIAGVGPLPGVNLQFVMDLLAGLFLASLRIGAFLIASLFSAVARYHCKLGSLWPSYLVLP